MAILSFEQELLSRPYHTEQAPSRAGFSELLGIVHYNQGLVEFADSKAGSLILLNSLLIAAVGALPSDGSLGVFKLSSVLLCSAAVYICFQVISTKDEREDDRFTKKRDKDWEQHDFLFFGCIGRQRSGDDFCRAFEESEDQERRRAILQRAYIISRIAGRKFAQYRSAQKVTSVALAVWVAVNLLPFLNI